MAIKVSELRVKEGLVKMLSSQDVCRWFRSHLSTVMSREAPAEMLAEADAHRDQCSDCESEYSLAVRVEQGLGVLPELSHGESHRTALDSLFARIGAQEPHRATAALAYDPTQPVELSLSCHEFSDMLPHFVAEELPVGTMLDGVEHAGSCRPCGDELSAMQSLQDAFRNLAELEAPASIYTSLMARIEAEEVAEAQADPEAAKIRKLSTARSKLLPVLG